MSSSVTFAAFLREAGFKFYVGVPDSVLRGFCAALERPDVHHVPAANEGAAVALGIGWHLSSGEVPVVYLQNSGLWNALNPYFTLAHRMVYDIPLLFVVGWRGRPGSKDEPQHRGSGAETETALRMMGISPFLVEKWNDDTAVQATKYLNETCVLGLSSAFLVPLGVLDERGASRLKRVDQYPSRGQMMTTIFNHVTAEDFVVAGIGHTGREVYAVRKKKEAEYAELLGDFLCVGGMGYALQVAMGAALGCPNKRIWCIEGDGSFLMHLGTAALVGIFERVSVTYVLLDNGAHASVGGQSTACGTPDYAAVAGALGFRAVEKSSTTAEAEVALQRLDSQNGPRFLWAKISNDPDVVLPRPHESLLDRKHAAMKILANGSPGRGE